MDFPRTMQHNNYIAIISWCGWCGVMDGMELKSEIQLLVQTGPDYFINVFFVHTTLTDENHVSIILSLSTVVIRNNLKLRSHVLLHYFFCKLKNQQQVNEILMSPRIGLAIKLQTQYAYSKSLFIL